MATEEPLAFEAFYRDERDQLARALALTLSDSHLAAEAVDEAMVRAYQRWERVAPTTTRAAGYTGSPATGPLRCCAAGRGRRAR